MEAAPATLLPIHLEPTEHPEGGSHFDELEQMLDKKASTPDQPQPTVMVLPEEAGTVQPGAGPLQKKK